jgi:hypothetical protein
MIKLRLQLLGLWVICLATSALLFTAMLYQALFGNPLRAYGVALAYDKCGNYALGGTKNISVSEQVGNALVAGKTWAKYVAWGIDLLMGKNHCLYTAKVK